MAVERTVSEGVASDRAEHRHDLVGRTAASVSMTKRDGRARSGQAPWLTVIMPVYRGERWIEASLESLAREADDGMELLVIDSSPDSHTADIVRHFSNRVRLRIEEHSLLPSWQAKTNHAVRIAAADHLCWLHHDDLWLPGRAAAIRRWINQAPGAALHIAASAIIDQDGQQIGIWRCPFRREGEIPHNVFLEAT